MSTTRLIVLGALSILACGGSPEDSSDSVPTMEEARSLAAEQIVAENADEELELLKNEIESDN